MFMITLSLLLATLSFAQPEPDFRFQYVPNEGEVATPCEHKRIRDLPDWEVNCDGPGVKKRFVAHVIFRETQRESSSSLEILYWVTQRDLNPSVPPKFHSTTARMHFKGNAAPMMMTFEQGVENDMASLQLNWRR
jgi:hypothetical protein